MNISCLVTIEQADMSEMFEKKSRKTYDDGDEFLVRTFYFYYLFTNPFYS